MLDLRKILRTVTDWLCTRWARVGVWPRRDKGFGGIRTWPNRKKAPKSTHAWPNQDKAPGNARAGSSRDKTSGSAHAGPSGDKAPGDLRAWPTRNKASISASGATLWARFCAGLGLILRRIWAFLKSRGFRRGVGYALLGTLALAMITPFALGINPFSRIRPEQLQNPRQAMRVYDNKGVLTATRSGVENRIFVPLTDLPAFVPNAFVAAEDTRFYTHFGIDVWRIGGALVQDLKSGSKAQGASTITQQLVKNTMLNQQKTFTRKIREAILAMMLESQYSKTDILEMYLNNAVYFGRNAYSIESAALAWFGVPASGLSIEQSALLAAIMPAPSYYSPDKNAERAQSRRNRVLKTMFERKFITEVEYYDAIKSPVTVVPNRANDESYGYYMDEVIRECCALLDISAEELLSGGYRIDTALDPARQSFLEETVTQDKFYPKSDEKIQCASVLINPKTGGVLAMVGGRDYTIQRGLNRATQIRRQPGSAIKPVLVYAPAFEYAGYNAADFVLDEFEDFGGYMPNNSTKTTHGWITVREAVEKSMNIPAVRILADIGLNTGKLYAKRVGIPFDAEDNHLALALGGFKTGVSPMQLCGAFQPFANGGTYVAPWLVVRITDSEGKAVYERNTIGETVLSPQTAYMMTDLLQSVTQPDGTGRVFSQMNVRAAGKTGTVDYEGRGNRDAWMVAYNQSLCGVVWMGHDDGSPLPQEVLGGANPARLLATLLANYPDDVLPPTLPEGLIRVGLDRAALNQLHLKIAPTAADDGQVQWELFRESAFAEMAGE